MAKRPLFAGLSIDDPKPSQLYNANFTREQSNESRKAHLQSPPVLPKFRVMPGDMPKGTFDQARTDLVYKRGKNGPMPFTGTSSVPAGLRKSGSDKARTPRVSKDGRRRTRSHPMEPGVRSKSAQKVVYNGRIGMTARSAMTSQKRESVELNRALSGLVAGMRREISAADGRISDRVENKRALADALGRERDALARGDKEAAAVARADVRRFRKASQYKGV
ncbi:hypothetical protein AB0H73_06280 [Streptomyces olivoreticuli]